MEKLILFDIDGTLIDSKGAGRRALERAMEKLTGISNGFSGIELAGKTDIQIMREGFEKWGIASSDGLINAMVELYLFFLEEEVKLRTGELKKGVMELLIRLHEMESTYLGLLTGNLEKGARIKLDPYDINSFFPIGAFGSDNEDRNRLLPIAIERLYKFRRVSVTNRDCIIIGDTPRDVACAKAHGSPSIAVATGPFSAEMLMGTGADLVINDLSDTDILIRWIKEI